jgi:hypothetical protein
VQSENSSNGERGSCKEDKFAVTAPSITLPKGGGAISGIGEKFAANPVTGTGSMTVPLFTSPGRSGFGPQLSLSYDSGAGNGPFGFGWSLSVPSISRRTDPSAGACRFPRSAGGLTAVCRNTTIPMNPTSSSCPARRTWSRSS